MRIGDWSSDVCSSDLLGKAAVQREGTDLTIIGYGRPIADALAVAEKLAAEGISIEVVDLRTIAPFDAETVLNSVAKTRRAVIVHEAVKEFGVGAELSSRIHEELFSDLKAPVARVGSRFAPEIGRAWCRGTVVSACSTRVVPQNKKKKKTYKNRIKL